MSVRVAACLVLWCFSVSTPASTADEVRHLLEYIGTSDCSFVRNGLDYDARAAGAHIRMKYDHGRDSIETAEQFIDYAATRSYLTRVPYRVKCAGREQLSADWLTTELIRYRSH
jgi:hypothetical protein